MVLFPGDMAALEDEPNSDIITLKDIIFSKADGHSKVLVETYVGAETLDTYLRRKVSVTTTISCAGFGAPKPPKDLNPKAEDGCD